MIDRFLRSGVVRTIREFNIEEGLQFCLRVTIIHVSPGTDISSIRNASFNIIIATVFLIDAIVGRSIIVCSSSLY